MDPKHPQHHDGLAAPESPAPQATNVPPVAPPPPALHGQEQPAESNEDPPADEIDGFFLSFKDAELTPEMFSNLSQTPESPIQQLTAAVAPPAPPPLPAAGSSNLVSAGNINIPAPQAPPARASRAYTEQRKWVKKLRSDPKEIAKYLHMTEEDASKALGISTSSLRRAYRSHNNLDPWPARKVQSLNRRIQKLQENVGKRRKWLWAMEKIQELEAERDEIYARLKKAIEKATTIADKHPSADNAGGLDPPSPDGGNAGAPLTNVN